MLGRSSRMSSRPRPSPGGGTPSWLVFLLGVALVFGAFYLYQGLRDYAAATGISGQATREAATRAAILERPSPTRATGGSTGGNTQRNTGDASQPQSVVEQPVITLTPVPECQDFMVMERANVRDAPNTSAGVIEIYEPGTTVCVLGVADENADWYLIDMNPISRRVVAVYIFGDLLRAINPTATPTRTFTPAPTVTPLPTETPSITPSPRPTQTPDPDATDTPTPTPTITPTISYQSA